MIKNTVFVGGIIIVVAIAFGVMANRQEREEVPRSAPSSASPRENRLVDERPLRQTSGAAERVKASGELSFLSLSQGFSLNVFARELPGARVMAPDPSGNIVVSLLNPGRVVVVRDINRDGMADETKTLLSGLNQPHGLAFHCEDERCFLYVAETHRVMRYPYDMNALVVAPGESILDLPFGRGHATRTLLIAPLGGVPKLFAHVGSSCNVCVESDVRRATLLVADLDGRNARVFASGLRNSVFFTLHPVTGEIWATDNGRDRLGDDVPPDEINIVRDGGNYGWPYCYGKNIHDDEFDPNGMHPCTEPEALPSHIDIQAHSAALGLAFVSGGGWPEEYQNNLFVAYHGSWNRSVPTGYKVVRYRLDAQGRGMEEDFITGWIDSEGTVRGRPVALLAQADGILYISDDRAGVIYRVISSR
jgi:glucose/arabinose dehydrogenase